MFLGNSDVSAAYDGVVIGSGPAGLSLALEFGKGARRVLVLESADEAQPRGDLSNSIGYGHYSGDYWNRHSIRELGGTSKVWSGWVTTPRDLDFDNPAVGSRWPIGLSDLVPYYERAAAILDRDRSIVGFEKPLWRGFLYRPYSRQQATRFSGKYIDGLKSSTNVDVAAGCSAVGLDANEARASVRTVRYVHHASGTTRQLTVAPSQFVVLAMGGLGNAQFLLQPRADGGVPVGTESGHVGRCIMEHPHFYGAGECILDEDLDAHSPPAAFGRFAHALVADRERSLAHRLLACSLTARRTPDHELARRFSNESGRRFHHYLLDLRSEMLPSAGNHVFLTGERDGMGFHRAGVRCVLDARDFTNAEMTLRVLGETLIETGRGRVRINNDMIYRQPNGGGHILGTTRMGESPSTSVVDRDCRVHGYDNLFIAGSSVFTTGGYANPTFTIVALALRLADRLAQRARS